MKNTAQIQIKDAATEVRFEWQGFDGDRCFEDFHIELISNADTQHYDLGACAVHALRKLTRFFQETSQSSVSVGSGTPTSGAAAYIEWPMATSSLCASKEAALPTNSASTAILRGLTMSFCKTIDRDAPRVAGISQARQRSPV